MLLTVNGTTYDLALPRHATLLAALRDGLDLTGTKLVCDRGECGACTVLLDGEPAYACLTLAAACEGQTVTTIEGLSPASAGVADLHPVQRAFVAHDALQCGFCTPGQVMAAVGLLLRTPLPSEAEVVRWMSGNLCRCGTYPKIVRAVMDASRAMHVAEAADAD